MSKKYLSVMVSWCHTASVKRIHNSSLRKGLILAVQLVTHVSFSMKLQLINDVYSHFRALRKIHCLFFQL